MGTQDLTIKRPVTVSPIPTFGTAGATVTVGANSVFIIQINNQPDSGILSIWNFLYSVYIDTNDAAHSWPLGASLGAGLQSKIVITDHLDWGDSSDLLNTRNQKIYIQNTDTASHTCYLYYKAYTFAAAAAR